MLKKLIDRNTARRWNKAKGHFNWWTSPRLVEFHERTICDEAPFGVVGAVLDAVDGAPAERGISVGAGDGGKERRLLGAGAVGRFDTFELADERAEASRRASAEAGLQGRMNEQVGDAFALAQPESYDLCYWDHSLHHMLDVAQALDWSVRVLKPGGLLVVNEYVGANRLQWPRREVDYARGFLSRHSQRLGVSPGDLKYRTPITRLKQLRRDPSEAPQSDRIEASFEAVTGSTMRPLGGMALHLLAPFVLKAAPDDTELLEDLCRVDEQACRDGMYHFAIGLWRKPL